ncbi:MAG: aldose epimerase family protein [Candidatus Promineifilaceae bacterium]|nr:aldose epimerase family protein [Candidatus Promineifilaceae bacterium]
MKVEKRSFGKTADGTAVDLYTLTNDRGMQVRISNYGGTITSIRVPNREGEPGEITLGFDQLAQYEQQSSYFGCLVGRYANRIAEGRFSLDGKAYALAQNNGPNHLHGGRRGFDKVVWRAEMFHEEGRAGINLYYQSRDGEENYPGTLDVKVVYTINNDNALTIAYQASTDKETIVNLTNHTYFNLAGSGDILGHEVVLYADSFTPIDETLIPTGEIRSVANSPMDFRTATPVGARIDEADEQLKLAGGYDHNWVLKHDDEPVSLAAVVNEPTSGRVLEVYTSQPGIQFYTGNFLDSSIAGRAGETQRHRGGLCLETQHYPDSPNKPQFPSTILKPGEVYRQTTIYKFPA